MVLWAFALGYLFWYLLSKLTRYCNAAMLLISLFMLSGRRTSRFVYAEYPKVAASFNRHGAGLARIR